MRQRVLVTGGAGFIGSRLVVELVQRGDSVVVVDNLAGPQDLRLLAGVLERIEFIRADIRNPAELSQIPPGHFDVVYHLASSFANQLSIEEPALDFEINVQGTEHVVELCRNRDAGHLVFTGSSSSYGVAPLPLAEEGPMNPETPYGRTKKLAEEIVARSGVTWSVFRLFNVYGPGDYPGRYRNLIPNMMRAAASAEQPLRVFGADATRDFNYVDDVVRLLLSPERAADRIVNIGSGIETPVLTVARVIQRLFGVPDRRLSIESPRTWDRVVRRAASIDRLRALFPDRRLMPLDSGLRNTAAWLRAQGFLDGTERDPDHARRATPALA
jgi:UDP-glucose 4-epimerase